MKILRALLVLGTAAAIAACGDDPSGPGGVDSIVFPASTQYVRLGTSAPVQVTLLNAQGTAVPGATAIWSSSDTTIASVSPGGLVVARAYGAATLTARVGRVSGSVTVQVTGQPGVRVVSGAGVTDTITAPLTAPLVVEVRDSLGMPVTSRDVYFHTHGVPTDGMKVGPRAGEVDDFYRARTNANGRVSVAVQMSGAAGIHKLVAAVTGPMSDTAVFTVLPGAPVRLVLQPRDTAVFTGRQLTFRPRLTDRGGNPAPGTLTWSVSRGPATVNPAGVLAAGVPGVIWVQARIGALVDSMWVSSVPLGAMVHGAGDGMYVSNLDGSGRRRLGTGTQPAWSPAGDRVVFVSEHGSLVTRTLTGPVVPVSGTAGGRAWPRFSPDGQWIYYQFANDSIARIRPDGTGQQALAGLGTRAGHPSLSPDGTKLVFYDAWERPIGLSLFDFSTGVVTRRMVVGHTPSWSPAGDLIAFTEIGTEMGNWDEPIGIMVMRPDGGGLRRITTGEGRWTPPRWSPDGKWIIAGSGRHLHLFEVATGLRIPLGFLETSGGADLRPGGVLP